MKIIKIEIEKVWNGFVVNEGSFQTEVYLTLPEVLVRIVGILGSIDYTAAMKAELLKTFQRELR